MNENNTAILDVDQGI